MARPVRWDLIADPTRYVRGFDVAERRSRQFQRHTDRLHRTVSRLGVGLAATVGFSTLTNAARDFIAEARDAARVSRQTAAVVKSTGAAAGLSARGFEELAGKLSRLVAVDDEVIQSGENILATFTRIKAGGPDRIFERATMAALDMAAALNQGEITTENLQKANIQLGKALNDPIKGITALQRVGVSFTQAQRDQIKALVEAGDVTKAQKIILAELTKEFGGSAAAAADTTKKFQVLTEEVKERLGAVLLDLANKAMQAVIDQFDKLQAKSGELQGSMKDLEGTWRNNKQALSGLLTQLGLTKKGEGDLAGALKLVTLVIREQIFATGLLVRAFSFQIGMLKQVGAAVLVLVRTWLQGFRTVLSAAASAAEALHLPWARALRNMVTSTDRSLDAVQRRIDALHGKTIVMGVAWVARGIPPRVGSTGGTTPFRALQHGGIVTRPTMALIGEAGPEAVVPLSRGSGGAGRMVLEIRSGGSRMDDLLVEVLRKAVRSRGGDVQVVLGQG